VVQRVEHIRPEPELQFYLFRDRKVLPEKKSPDSRFESEGKNQKAKGKREDGFANIFGLRSATV